MMSRLVYILRYDVALKLFATHQRLTGATYFFAAPLLLFRLFQSRVRVCVPSPTTQDTERTSKTSSPYTAHHRGGRQGGREGRGANRAKDKHLLSLAGQSALTD